MRYVWIVLVVLVVAALAWFAMAKHALAPSAPAGPSVTLGTTTYSVEIADTPDKQQLGLGQRDSLAAGHGMLFVFPQAGNWGFWMKDTHFPLDMIWARADGTVINVAHDVATSTYAENPPEIFYPTTADALYVLEVNAGAAAEVQPGDKMTITI